MSIRGYLLGESTTLCPYISGNRSTNEQLLIENLDDSDLEALLAAGYRHFGTYFFRPVCSLCHKCLPLRIPVGDYRSSPSAKRALRRGARFRVTLERPHPTPEAHALYLKHKERFAAPPGSPDEESYATFSETFFHPFPFSFQLSVYDGEKLIAVSHLDMTDSVVSAVYCYYDDSYRRESLGSFAIFKEIDLAVERNLDFVYLGYYIRENPHMSYKARYRPNQVLREEGNWQDLLDIGGNIHDNIEELGEITFIPKHRLKGGH
jgi:arginine-tRNA-protein transferase